MRISRDSENSHQENRLERQLQQLVYPKVLIKDEIAYLPLDRQEAGLFFRLITRRYEKAATILTSNKGFVDWGDVFNDQIIATAILDQLLHHATTLNIKNERFRLKEKREAGLLTQGTGRPVQRPFRGLLSIHSRYGLHTRQVTRSDPLHQRLRSFRYLLDGSDCSGPEHNCPAGLSPTGKRRLCTAHTLPGRSP